jgi:hypothetical protein
LRKQLFEAMLPFVAASLGLGHEEGKLRRTTRVAGHRFLLPQHAFGALRGIYV